MDQINVQELAYQFDMAVPPLKYVFDVSGKVAIVTGGCTGLGFAVARRLGEGGAKVVIASRNEENGAKAQDYFRGKGYDVTYFKADVRDVDQCYAIVDFAEKTYGGVDILVPAAAVWDFYSAVDTPAEVFDDIQATNVKGQYYCIQAAARSMIKSGKGGRICMIASIMHTGVGDIPHLNMDSAYVTSKSALTGLCVSLAREFKQYGIIINCVAPGAMVTSGALSNGLAAHMLYGPEYTERIMGSAGLTPMSKTPDDMARVVYAMCTPMCDFMYGVTVHVDGGATITFMDKPWSYTVEGCFPGPKAE